ncbi:MAG: lactate racemase domain-containing protein [Verrucomicrobia bacterium]|nr:lactate racemase domain-containing protein [Verrucomicrobiota bacterium]MDA1066162.1 lactate racemase domain-containing protein [Verrucomicrobiota bacterium]
MPDYPDIFRVRQSFERTVITDIPAEVDAQLSMLKLRDKVRPGHTVAISAGSRGIANIHLVIKAIVDHFKGLGAKPFIVPAMGSHGGGTSEGQRGIIEGYGVTEEFCGCPIKASMETIIVCQADEGFPVHFDKYASEADHVVVCGRVKPHTNFFGDIQSGLMKMMLIGYGKHNGARIYHRAIKDFEFGQIVRSVGKEVLSRCNVVAGVGIVENAYDETAKIAAVAPEEFEEREKELLVLARNWLPRLPFDRCDLLLVDEIGKNISGSGLDTNVVGRKDGYHRAGPNEFPNIRFIGIRGLTEETHGNGCGIGVVEFSLTRAIDQVDMNITRINCLTGGEASGAMVPIHYPTDREVLNSALPLIGLTEPCDAKLMWIQNTLHVSELECSVAYLDEARERDDLEIIVEPRPLPLNEEGMLPEVKTLG